MPLLLECLGPVGQWYGRTFSIATSRCPAGAFLRPGERCSKMHDLPGSRPQFPTEFPMAIRIAINGYGRIGRNILRALYESGRNRDLQVVAVNDLGSPETNAHLTRYDTVHGRFKGSVEVEGDAMVVN